MPNTIKYNVDTESNALKIGYIWLGLNDVGKGPTASTDYWNGIPVPASGFVIYHAESSGIRGFVAISENDLIAKTNAIFGQGFTLIGDTYDFYTLQNDKTVLNRDYEKIVTTDTLLWYDCGFIPSYPRRSNTIYDMSSYGYTGTFDGTFVQDILATGGYFDFNGINNNIIIGGDSNINNFSTTSFSIDVWCYFDSLNRTDIVCTVIGNINTGGSTHTGEWGLSFDASDNLNFHVEGYGPVFTDASVTLGGWVNIVITRDSINGEFNIYADGNHIETIKQTLSVGYSGGNLCIGSNGNNENFFCGRIAIARLYRYCLTEEDVASNYFYQAPRFIP